MKDDYPLRKPMIISCPDCHARLRIYARYCYNCGLEINGRDEGGKLFKIHDPLKLYCPFCQNHNEFQDTYHCLSCWESGFCNSHMIKGQPICPTCYRAIANNEITDAMKEVQYLKGEEIPKEIFSQKDKTSPTENMVIVEAGSFLFGDDCKEVHLPSFFIDTYPVTNQQFKEFFPLHDFPTEEANCPVVRVTYYDAWDYAISKGKRLPTEMEWEKASRGTHGQTYPWGNDFNPNKCNCAEGGLWKLSQVDQFHEGRSPYGCYDMVGNCVEWVSDWYDKEHNYKVMKGSCFMDYDFTLRCANRTGFEPPHRFGLIGFRCAL
ncbi:MAG: SUMF1/EgtB/PvdO family nonheme iron enzyme [Spirochaetota bacterium]|nr:SUMF1/EgtB/PvdO family nonheme iron enzyme [Spirochaetota bacterium]